MHERNRRVLAPELSVAQWFNTDETLSLEKLRGRPVLMHAFQMLCPGCVALAIPQAQKAQAIFAKTDLQVIGLHTVFEHHDAMTPTALKAFLHEYRVTFPVGVDTPSPYGESPVTMAAYRMRGTPTTILVDRGGNVAANLFGQIEDLALGAMIQSILDETQINAEFPALENEGDGLDQCDADGCRITTA